MRKYVFMAMLVSLCACNNGGGHSGGGAKYNIGSSAGISGGTTTKPGEQPGGDNTTEKPGDNTQQPSDDIEYPNVPDSKKLTVSMGTFSTNANQSYKVLGIFDREKGLFKIQRVIPYGESYNSVCQNENGCDISYRYNEVYYQYLPNKYPSEYKTVCDLPKGCTVHADNALAILIPCRDIGGCVINDDIDSETVFDVKESDSGIFITDFVDRKISGSAELAIGSKKLSVPLRFSDFGYWSRTTTYDDSKSGTRYNFGAWKSGDPTRAVDMHTLADIGVITGNHTYSGKAFVGISTGLSENHSGSSSALVPLGDDMPGFIADGTVKLSFNADNGTENLVMDFTDAGWYKVYTKDNELVYVGNPTTDPKFKVENPKSSYAKAIQYYGPDAFLPATEAVGTVGTSNVQMQDGYYRNINFSFGAVKD